MRIGSSTPSAYYLGSTSVSKVYLGASEIWAAAPTLDSVTFTDNNDGTPAELTLTYSGDVTGYRVYIATGDATLSVSAAQLYAGSGGTGSLEFTDFAVGTNIDITGLTATSNSAVRIQAALIKSADGSDPSSVRIVTVSGLDFTAPTFSSAEVGTIDGDTLEITASKTLYGTPAAADFTLTGNTISAASIVGGKVRLTLGTTANTGDDYTGDLSYTQSAGSIVDGDGNELANFTSQNVTNNTSGPTFVSAEVGTVDADTLVIVGSETLSGTPNASDFTLTGNTISAAAISGGNIHLTLGTTATSSDDYTGDLSYTQSAGSIQNADGSELVDFASQNVTNNLASAFAPSDLFSTEEGLWINPSDISTMWTDTGGTTQVSSPGDLVARIDDQSGNGNNLTQATSGSRPIYGVEPESGRRNLLTYTEQFDDAVWTAQSGTTVTANSANDPNGDPGADLIEGSGTSGIFQGSFTVDGSSDNTKSVWIKAVSGTPSVTLKDPDQTIGTTTCNLTTSWARFTLTETQTGGSAGLWIDDIPSGGIHVWGAQLEQASAASSYQSVVSNFDVSEAGVASISYLYFDGVDDFLSSGTITPGGDTVQLVVGVAKPLPDPGSFGMIIEHGSTGEGRWYLGANENSGDGFEGASGGTTDVFAGVTTGYTRPTRNILSVLADISDDSLVLRADGVQIASDATDQGTGNYTAQSVYIGRRGGSSLPFNGRIYNAVVRFGPALSAGDLGDLETYVGEKTGVTV